MRIRRWLRIISLLLPLAAACAGPAGPARPGAPEPVDGRPMPADPDGRLRWSLEDRQSPERLAAFAALEDSLHDLSARLARIAVDTAAPAMVRANALLLLGQRGGSGELGVFWRALDDAEPLIRIAAASALGDVLAADEGAGIRLLRRALRDPEPRVQVAALESVGDSNVELLHEYLAAGPAPDLAKVATDLIRIAEERGAPLRPAAAAGMAARAGGAAPSMPEEAVKSAGAGAPALVLERTSASGLRLVFRASRTWPRWDAAVGELVVTPPGGAPITLSSEVEVVGRVVPAFFSVDGRYVVYEAAREIRVRDLAGGGERVIGPGIAPRVLPFTDSFVFLRERTEDRQTGREGITARYDVLRAPFAGGAPEPLGEIRAMLRMDRHGLYSPARWMRVRERDGVFTLEGESVGTFRLPDPFSDRDGGT